MEIVAGTRQYFVNVAGTRTPIVARQYLTTAADMTTENNLGTLPER